MSEKWSLGIVAQFGRFSAVGIVSNTCLLVLYLFLSAQGAGHMVAASVAWIVGIVVAFRANRSWTFRSAGPAVPSLAKYCVLYVTAWFTNLLVLFLLVDQLGYPHECVQAASIPVFAVVLFAAQRYWVFREVVR